jgi:hypothetical protein
MLMDLGRPVLGERWFVDSTHGSASDAATHGQNPELPFATADYANDACTAGQDDVIVLMPGHAETIAAAADLDLDTADVTMLSLGRGSKRAKFTISGVAGADIDIAGENVCVANCWFFNSEDGASAPLDVDGAYAELVDCLFENDGANDCSAFITAAAAAHRLRIRNCRNYGTDTAGGACFLDIAGALNHLEVDGLFSHGNFSAANIRFAAAATDVEIKNFFLENSNAVDVGIEGFAGVTGCVRNGLIRIATDGQTSFINTPGSLSIGTDVWGVNANGERGMAVGTPSA